MFPNSRAWAIVEIALSYYRNFIMQFSSKFQSFCQVAAFIFAIGCNGEGIAKGTNAAQAAPSLVSGGYIVEFEAKPDVCYSSYISFRLVNNSS